MAAVPTDDGLDDDCLGAWRMRRPWSVGRWVYPSPPVETGAGVARDVARTGPGGRITGAARCVHACCRPAQHIVALLQVAGSGPFASSPSAASGEALRGEGMTRLWTPLQPPNRRRAAYCRASLGA